MLYYYHTEQSRLMVQQAMALDFPSLSSDIK